MSIKFHLLGKPGKDNALMVWINSGTKLYRILFDCGENVLNELKYSDISSIDYLFFSHFHLDHAAGFDYFLRRNYDRPDKPVRIFGPQDTIKIIHHRLSGYTWNLVDDVPGKWIITEIKEDSLKTVSLKTSESFSRRHFSGKKLFKRRLIDNADFSVDAVLLNHIIPSAAYRITEKESHNIDKKKLSELNITPGPWLEKVKDFSVNGKTRLILNNQTYTISRLRKELLIRTEGESIAYLTDFIYDERSVRRAVSLIKNCDTVFCESQYSSADFKLAKKNYHLTASQTAMLAKKANAKKLILFHISDRYNLKEDLQILLNNAKEKFPGTNFPEEWFVESL